jgi:hypothetical protein
MKNDARVHCGWTAEARRSENVPAARIVQKLLPQAVLCTFVGSHFFRLHAVCHSQICDRPLQIHELQHKVRKLRRELTSQEKRSTSSKLTKVSEKARDGLSPGQFGKGANHRAGRVLHRADFMNRDLAGG